jgi:hypothetical protein
MKKYLNRLTGEHITALQWTGSNHYQVMKALEDDGDVCATTYTKDGLLRLFYIEGSLDLFPMDWIVFSERGVNCYTATFFSQVCEELP